MNMFSALHEQFSGEGERQAVFGQFMAASAAGLCANPGYRDSSARAIAEMAFDQADECLTVLLERKDTLRWWLSAKSEETEQPT